MRVTRPETLKLDREALLADVRARLEQRLGEYAGVIDDPSDPGWMLVEEAAWMVEMLSEQLDEWPWATLRQLVHLMGSDLRPARPSIGVVVGRPLTSGRRTGGRGRGDTLSFTSTATETRDLLSFVPLEPEVGLVPAELLCVSSTQDGQLRLHAHNPGASTSLAKEVAWIGRGKPSKAFHHERLRFALVGSAVDELRVALERGVEHLKARGVAWLRADITELDDQQIAIDLRVDPGAAFAEAAPGGRAAGGSIEIEWGSLDESVWTPPVRVADDPRLPLDLRRGRPLPGSREGMLRIPDVPVDFPVARLLVVDAAPLPADVVEAAWRTLANADRRLATLRPRIERDLVSDDGSALPEDAAWIRPVLAARRWNQLAGEAGAHLVHLGLPNDAQEAGTLRVAVVDSPTRGQAEPTLSAWAIDEDGALRPGALRPRRAWALPTPPPDQGQRLVRVVAWDIPIEDPTAALLLRAPAEAQAVMLNTMLVGNMPVVDDEREVAIERTVPTAVSLTEQDIVTKGVMQELLREPLPEDVRTLLRALPLARFSVNNGEPIDDFEGVDIDAAAGELVLNAPDAAGHLRTMRPGTEVTLNWHRTTQGADGDVAPGEIAFVEQLAAERPRIMRVSNPLPTFFGQDREDGDAAIERIFAPSAGVPVLASDWEREVRIALGTRGAGWLVRVWSYGERAHVSGALWPWGDPDEADVALSRELAAAGPESLVVFVGVPDGGGGHPPGGAPPPPGGGGGVGGGGRGGAPPAPAPPHARKLVEGVVARFRDRLPAVRRAIVGRLWPLSLIRKGPGAHLPLPCFDVHEMDGSLADPTGRLAQPPRASIILNAAVVRVSEV